MSAPAIKVPALAVNHDSPGSIVGQRFGDALFQALAHALAERIDRGIIQGEDSH